MAGGGSERQLALLSAGLVRAGMQVFVVLLYPGPNMPKLEESGARMFSPPVFGNYDPRLISFIKQLVSSNRIDLIQSWLPQMDVFGGIASHLAGVPHILSERACAAAYPTSTKTLMRRAVGRHAAAVAANSQGGIDYWTGKNKSALSRVIRNIVPLVNKDAFPGKVRNTKRVIYAGRYDLPQKNLLRLMQALALVLVKFPDVDVDLYGEGPLKNALIRLRDSLDLAARVQVNHYADDLISRLRDADLFVSPSTFEGTPNTVIEAASCACPLVVSDIPAHREFLDEDSAYFVNPTSIADIARGLENALYDPQGAARKGLEARRKVSAWTLDAISNQYLSLYDDVLRGQTRVH